MKERKSKGVEKMFAFLRFAERHVTRYLYPYKLYGNTTLYRDCPLVIVGNHYSFVDIMYPMLFTDQPVHFVAKQTLWKKRGFIKWFVNTTECIPAKRDGSDVQTVKTCLKVLKEGGVINIFPEGTRNKSYQSFLPFKGGAAALAIKTQTPIIPIVKINKARLFRKTYVVVGDPIEFRQYYGKRISKDEIDECDAVLHDAMWNMRRAFLDKYPIKLKEKNK